MNELIKKYEGHFVKIFCKNSIMWHGKLLKVDETSLLIRDKYRSEVVVQISSIENLQDLGVGI